jgi:hypothetical protein
MQPYITANLISCYNYPINKIKDIGQKNAQYWNRNIVCLWQKHLPLKKKKAVKRIISTALVLLVIRSYLVF